VGALTKGAAWGRPADLAGAGVGAGFISRIHADYLRLGGIDGFIGDGNLRRAPETNVEIFYSANFLRAFWLSGDYQRIWNPAFNADRGPVNVFGVRIHGQY
jgi:carbohydrate-selective porin OprB